MYHAAQPYTLGRLLKAKQDREAAKVIERRTLKMAAAAVNAMEEMVSKRLCAEVEAMALEDRRSREVRTSCHAGGAGVKGTST